jgi:energy-coupling factor transport system ATP-binding protein
VAIVGENGSGKTTLLKLLLGLLKPQEGAVWVAGLDGASVSTAQLAARVGFVLQNPDSQLFAETVEAEVGFGPRNLGLSDDDVEKRVVEALSSLRLDSQREAFPLALSRGERTKVVLASVLSMRPRVLILDEPTTGQDLPGSRQVMAQAKRFQEQGGCVIMATHDMSVVAEYSTRVLVLHGGEGWMDGAPGEVFAKPDRLAEANVSPPQITRLAQALPADAGAPTNVLTVEAMADWISGRIQAIEDAREMGRRMAT